MSVVIFVDEKKHIVRRLKATSLNAAIIAEDLEVPLYEMERDNTTKSAFTNALTNLSHAERYGKPHYFYSKCMNNGQLSFTIYRVIETYGMWGVPLSGSFACETVGYYTILPPDELVDEVTGQRMGPYVCEVNGKEYSTQIPYIVDGTPVFEIADWRYTEPEHCEFRGAQLCMNPENKLLVNERPIVTETEWTDRFCKWTDGLELVRDLDWRNIIIAGGFLYRLLRPDNGNMGTGEFIGEKSGDIDFFVYGSMAGKKAAVDRLLTHLYKYAMGKNLEFKLAVLGSVVQVTIENTLPIQIICACGAKTPLDVVKRFTNEMHNMLWFDGEELRITAEAFYYICKNTLVIHDQSYMRPWRMLKGWKYGMHVEIATSIASRLNTTDLNTWLREFMRITDTRNLQYKPVAGIDAALAAIYFGKNTYITSTKNVY